MRTDSLGGMSGFGRMGWRIAIVVGLSVLFSLFLGKDVNWDLVNYHLYAPHMALQGTMALDFMGGGPQSYFNPTALFPFHAMVKAGWHPVLIGVVLAAAHSLNLVFVLLLAQHIFSGNSHRELWTWLTVLLAAVSPLYWGVAGSTFADAWASIPLMAAVWAIARSINAKRQFAWTVLAGLLTGLAVGLKLSAAPFFLAGCAAVLVVPSRAVTPAFRMRLLAGFAATAFVGWLASAGWWCWRLYAEFGNPMFPLLNEFFKSPDYPAVSAGHSRFTPEGLADYLMYPFWMALSNSWVYIENSAPDFRPAILLITLLVALLVAGLRPWPAAHRQGPHMKVLWVYVGVSYIVWYALSGNGRYALPLFLLIGLLQTGLLASFGPALRPSAWAVVIIVVQATVFLYSGNPRWNPQSWGERWLEVNIPQRLLEEPHGFLSLHINSTSFVSPFMPAGAGFLSLNGLLPLYPGGYGDDRVRRFLAHYDGRLEALIYTGDTQAGNFVARPAHPGLSPWGLEVVPQSCAKLIHMPTPAPGMGVYSCAVRKVPLARSQDEEERKKLTPLFDKVQAACPKLFNPPDWPLAKQGTLWVRRHLGTDITVFLKRGRFYYSRYDFGPFDVDLGPVEDWAAGKARPDCTIPARHFMTE